MDLSRYLSWLPVERLKNPPPLVAVVRLAGVLGDLSPLRGGLTLARLERDIERAFKLPRLKAVALQINSPGGSPVQSDLIARRIRDRARESETPVLAFCEDVAASGGYWLACAADEIFVNESSIVGSIGVISAGFGFDKFIGRYGIERRIHTAGDRKSMLDPFRPEDPEDVERLKRIQEEVHRRFQDMVLERRGEHLHEDREVLFSGEFWAGRTAVDLGLADEVGEMRSVLRERFGESVIMVPVRRPRSWLRRRLGLGERATGGGFPAPEDWVRGAFAALEERALWARFGL